jgi:hypothetical protein
MLNQQRSRVMYPVMVMGAALFWCNACTQNDESSKPVRAAATRPPAEETEEKRTVVRPRITGTQADTGETRETTAARTSPAVSPSPRSEETTKVVVQNTEVMRVGEQISKAANLLLLDSKADVNLQSLKSEVTKVADDAQSRIPDSMSRKSVITDALSEAQGIIDSAANETTSQGRAGMLRKAAEAMEQAGTEMQQLK